MNECDLRARIAELEGRVAELEGTGKKTSLAAQVEAVPINRIRWEYSPHPYYSKGRYEAWSLFVALAKTVNSQQCTFEKGESDWHGQYTRSIDAFDKVKKLEDIAPWDMTLTAEMIEEMVKVYNAYYQKLHPSVLCRDESGKVLAYAVSGERGKCE